jgi:uncharacterized protein
MHLSLKLHNPLHTESLPLLSEPDFISCFEMKYGCTIFPPYLNDVKPYRRLMLKLILFVIFCPLLCIGQIPTPKPDTYLNDFTNTLQPYDIQRLNEQLLVLEKKSTVQMAILLINTLPENMTIEDYARMVGSTWKVGNKYNGLVYVAVLEERKHRLEVARNLEGDIPDITAFEIIESLKPYLREQQYFTALQQLISKVSSHLGVETQPVTDTSTYAPFEETRSEELPPEQAARSEYEREKAKYDRWGNYAIGAIILGLSGFCIWAWRYKKRYVRNNTINGVYIGVGSSYFASTYGSDYGSSDSGGPSGFGGWGGGGGGGGFSGGGASGSW